MVEGRTSSGTPVVANIVSLKSDIPIGIYNRLIKEYNSNIVYHWKVRKSLCVCLWSMSNRLKLPMPERDRL